MHDGVETEELAETLSGPRPIPIRRNTALIIRVATRAGSELLLFRPPDNITTLDQRITAGVVQW